MKLRKWFLLLFFSVNVTGGFSQHAQPVVLPNGWRLTPAGKQLPLGDLPLNMAISPNGRWMAVTNNGYGRQSIKIFDTKKEQEVDDQTIAKSWYGLNFSHDGKWLYASAGNDNQIKMYQVSPIGKLTLSDSIVMGKQWPMRISPSGIGVNPKTGDLFVLTRWDNSMYIYRPSDKKLLKKVDLGGEGYQVIVSSDGKFAYASCWGCDQVRIWDIRQGIWAASIPVGSHPNEMCLDEKKRRLFVTNANDNSVSVINLEQQKVEEVLNTALFSTSLSGSTTNGLCLLRNGKQLAIANADNNCLAIFDVSEPSKSRSLGFIPVGWYPTNVKFANDKLWVTNGKGLHSSANPFGPNPANLTQRVGHHEGDTNRPKEVQYIGGLFLGALSIIDIPSDQQLKVYSQQVFSNTPYDQRKEYLSDSEPGNPIPQRVGDLSPIKYVFYIIKENRTYDQVLGDIPKGNGDSTLTLFGNKITPNLHKIANEFVLLDNFYVNAEVSCDGHNWTTGAYATDYLEKTWPSNYSSRGDVYAGEGGHPMGNNKNGFVWDLCSAHDVSYRSYAEFCDRKNENINGKTVKGEVVPTIKSLEGHVCKTYEPWNMDVRDTTRYYQWAVDFDSLLDIGQVPQFNTLRFGNDHTEGMRLNRPTPFAHVADNDLAVGLMVDHLSHSPIWKESVVFIIEDDAQNGCDHVDAHRSTAYLAGGYVKRHFVDSTPYTTTSMLKTIELILGLPPMTQYDAGARSMWRCFSQTADTSQFHHLAANIPLNQVNQKQNRWQAMSDKYDFDTEDNVPDIEFNQVLWHGIKGDTAVYPGLRRSAFLTYSMNVDDD